MLLENYWILPQMAEILPHSSALDSWHGWRTPTPGRSLGKKDFKREGRNQVIEVKTTGKDLHRITNYLQLVEDAPPEHLYLYSVSANIFNRYYKLARNSWKDNEQITNQGLKDRFTTRLNSYGGVGYYHAHAPFYQNLENRLLVNIFSPELFDIRRIDNFDGSHFSAGAPAHSSEYSYLLTLPDSEIIANPEAVLLQLIQ